MTQKSEFEVLSAKRLLQALGLEVSAVRPMEGHSMPDVLIREAGGRRIAIEVTRFYADHRGRNGGSIAQIEEKEKQRRAKELGKLAYSGWGSNNPFPEIKAAVRKKAQKAENYSLGDVDGLWLLVVSQVPNSLISTFIAEQLIDQRNIEELFDEELRNSRFDKGFLYLWYNDHVFAWDRERTPRLPSRPDDEVTSLQERIASIPAHLFEAPRADLMRWAEDQALAVAQQLRQQRR